MAVSDTKTSHSQRVAMSSALESTWAEEFEILHAAGEAYQKYLGRLAQD